MMPYIGVKVSYSVSDPQGILGCIPGAVSINQSILTTFPFKLDIHLMTFKVL